MASKEPEQKGWQLIAEARIRSAMEAGAFEGLPGAGRPLPDLDEDYDENWWLKKWLKREKAGITPPTLAARIETVRELERLEALDDEAALRAGLAALNERIARQNKFAWAGPTTTTGEVDIEAVVRRWRKRKGR